MTTTMSEKKVLNGFDVEAMQKMNEAASAGPEQAAAGFGVRSEWKGGTVTEATVESWMLAGKELKRSHRIRTDEPVELMGTDSAPNPQELLFAALNACMMFGYAAGAAEMGIELQSLTIETKGVLDLRGSLEIADVPNGFPKIDYTVWIKADASAEQIEELHQAVQRTSPNYYHISQSIPLEARLILG